MRRAPTAATIPDVPVDLQRRVRQLRADALRPGAAVHMSTPHAHRHAGEPSAYEERLPLRWYARLVRRLCPSTGRVLNFGCGDGALLKRLSSHCEAFGYDAAPLARSRCRTNVPDAVILEAWESQPPASFDLIVSVQGMERLAQPLQTVKRMAEKLTGNGILLFTVPNPGGLGRRLKGARWFASQQSARGALLTHGEWVMLLRKAGFEVVSVCGDGLWDVPYVGLLPTGVQRLLFGVPGALQAWWPAVRPLLPAAVGECLVIMARKPQ
jgi:2-polyprenyl-6-hydroxyphenyl methylase/3-demethylubiquinone-9 3-methyltransferase